MNTLKSVAAGISLALVSSSVYGQLVVTQNDNATDLANSLIGTGVSLVSGSAALTADSPNQAGTFTGGGSLIGIEDGIILSTGNVLDAPGPNSDDSTSSSYGGTPFDSALLEFQVSTDTGNLFFNFVFASEEYTEYSSSSFNDLFSLSVNGVNRALVPGTSDPVEVNSVNQSTNSAFFNDNDIWDSSPTSPVNLEYDGFTDVFTAAAIGLGAGNHTISFYIQDENDNVFDSAVFIQGSSFTSTNPVPEPSTVGALVAGSMVGLLFLRRRMKRKAA